MFASELGRTIDVAARVELPMVSAALWRALAAGQVSEAEAEALSNRIEAKRALPPASRPAPQRVGSRPYAPSSLERRRSWTASGRLPPSIAARVTPGEAAVLAVVAVEVRRSGDCRWPHGRLAAVAGVSVSTVRRALRQAQALAFVTVEERRVSAFRSDTNIVRIVCPAWRAWLRLGGGVQIGLPSTSRYSDTAFVMASGSLKGARQGKGKGAARALDGPSGPRRQSER